MIASAVGERQILPRHTKSTRLLVMNSKSYENEVEQDPVRPPPDTRQTGTLTAGFSAAKLQFYDKDGARLQRCPVQ
jgi:hypothetical protein